MAYKDLNEIKARLVASAQKPKPKKRTYRKRPRITNDKRLALIVDLRNSATYLDEVALEHRAKTYQAWRSGLTLKELSEALGITEAAAHQRIRALKSELGVS